MIEPWGSKVTVEVHRIPEADKVSGDLKLETSDGAQPGTSITSLKSTAREALCWFSRAQVELAYSEVTAVEDARGRSRFKHSKMWVNGERGRFKGTQLA